MTNPILVEVTRAAAVESFHRGALVVATPDGRTVLSLGDVTAPVFARSAIKIIQALPLLESGAADAYGFTDSELALACGSHIGADRHVAVGAGMLARLAMVPACLACGPARPSSPKAAERLAANGSAPTPLHHPCSGKHAGMLAIAKHLGADLSRDAYTHEDHPVQRQTRATLEALAGVTVTQDACGIDGCSVPTWALSPERLAAVFARLVTGEGLSTGRRHATRRILEACWAEPELVAGVGRAETVILSALPGRVYLKSGAEGITCGAFPELGLGFALKIDDGASRAAAAAVMPLIERIVPEAHGLIKRSTILASNGTNAGGIRISKAYQQALDGLAV